MNNLIRLLGLLLLCSTASAQFPRRLSDEARISLLTLAPGTEVHTLFGHGTLRVLDPKVGFDASFNYGTFEFGEGFLQKFLYGELDYYLSVLKTQPAIDEARQKGRSVIEQELALTADQRERLYQALVENAQPENRTYRYDFLFDNCSTRLVDMLRDNLGANLVLPTGPYEPKTFRTLLAEHVTAFPWIRFGFDLLLGATVDREASFEQTWFLPRHLMAALDDASLDGHALVAKRIVLNDSGHEDLPPGGVDQPAILFWSLFGLAAVFAAKDRRGRVSRAFDATLFALVGLVGLIMALMWGATLHHVTADNWNLAWAWPTHLVAAIFLARRARPAWLRGYLSLTVCVSIVVALGFGIPQQMAPAILPIGLLIALRAALNLRNQAPHPNN